jgi:hypothetical protein
MSKKAAPAKKAPPAKRPVAKKPAAKRAAPPAAFADVFRRLKAILTPYAKTMTVVKDTAEWYYLDTKHIGKNKKPICFAAVRLGKAYVSFYLMCAYCNPKILASISPALKKRMQGKSCFNFKAVDAALFAELEQITKFGADWFDTIDWANYKWTTK